MPSRAVGATRHEGVRWCDEHSVLILHLNLWQADNAEAQAVAAVIGSVEIAVRHVAVENDAVPTTPANHTGGDRNQVP